MDGIAAINLGRRVCCGRKGGLKNVEAQATLDKLVYGHWLKCLPEGDVCLLLLSIQ